MEIDFKRWDMAWAFCRIVAQRRRDLLRLLIAVCCLAPLNLRAQSEGALTYVVVTPSTHAVTSRITAGDLQIDEGKDNAGRAPAFVQPMPSLRIGFLLDESGSARHSPLQAYLAKHVLDWGASTTAARDGDAFLLAFNDEVIISTGLVPAASELRPYLDQLRPIGGSAIRDALVSAAVKFSSLASKSEPKARIIILISDGSDDASRAKKRDTMRFLQMMGVRVYSIGFSSRPEPSGKGTLEDFSKQTGGLAYFPRSEAEVASVLDKIGQDISNSFLVGFVPRGPGGKLNRLKIGLATLPKVGLRTQSKYWAPR